MFHFILQPRSITRGEYKEDAHPDIPWDGCWTERDCLRYHTAWLEHHRRSDRRVPHWWSVDNLINAILKNRKISCKLSKFDDVLHQQMSFQRSHFKTLPCNALSRGPWTMTSSMHWTLVTWSGYGHALHSGFTACVLLERWLCVY